MTASLDVEEPEAIENSAERFVFGFERHSLLVLVEANDYLPAFGSITYRPAMNAAIGFDDRTALFGHTRA